MLTKYSVLDTAGTALSGHGVYTYLIKHFGDPTAIAGIDTCATSSAFTAAAELLTKQLTRSTFPPSLPRTADR